MYLGLFEILEFILTWNNSIPSIESQKRYSTGHILNEHIFISYRELCLLCQLWPFFMKLRTELRTSDMSERSHRHWGNYIIYRHWIFWGFRRIFRPPRHHESLLISSQSENSWNQQIFFFWPPNINNGWINEWINRTPFKIISPSTTSFLFHPWFLCLYTPIFWSHVIRDI